MNVFEPNRQLPGSRISNAPENDSFIGFLNAFKIRVGAKEDCMNMGESKSGVVLQDS